MAKLEKTLSQDFDRLLLRLSRSFWQGSLLLPWRFQRFLMVKAARCSVRVLSGTATRRKRLSLNLTLFQAGNGPVQRPPSPPAAARRLF